MMKKLFYKLVWINIFYLVACSSVRPAINTPKISASEANLRPVLDKDDTLIILTFSGGGTRAAAFSYGVLKGLRETSVGKQTDKNLLDAVDVISSVSGGSFTAAYYGLFGERIFSDYERVFLKHPVQSELIKSWLSPRSWGKLGSTNFSRTDLTAEYYDANIFGGKSFADMRTDKPFIVINATDISTGGLFTFTPENMQLICSTINDYPVSRAVAASSAVPGVFSPIMLENYSGCSVSKHWKVDKDIVKFMDKGRYPYLHLVDGGISDNLGIRGFLRLIQLQDGNLPLLLKKYKLNKIKHIAFIVVNAADDIVPSIAQKPEEPSAAETLGAVSTIQLKRYNRETLKVLKARIQGWQEQEKSKQCKIKESCHPIDLHLIELNFKQLPKALADDVSLYETSLELSEKQVDTLIYSGQYLLKKNENFKKLLHYMKKQ